VLVLDFEFGVIRLVLDLDRLLTARKRERRKCRRSDGLQERIPDLHADSFPDGGRTATGRGEWGAGGAAARPDSNKTSGGVRRLDMVNIAHSLG